MNENTEHKNPIHDVSAKETGRVHSFESFGTVDGPGIRFVVFLQGCQFKCLYCHNRDTWDLKGGTLYSVDDIMKKILSVKTYIKSGGLTVSGGEPLLQSRFVSHLFKAAHAEGIHTCLDTNGYHKGREGEMNASIKSAIDESDLVLLDIKHMDIEGHMELTDQPLATSLEMAEYLTEINKLMRVRFVVVPGYTHKEEIVHKLGAYLKDRKNLELVEILPFHKLGSVKWEGEGEVDPLKDVESLKKDDVQYVQDILAEYGIKSKL